MEELRQRLKECSEKLQHIIDSLTPGNDENGLIEVMREIDSVRVNL